MLTELYIDALLVDEELADLVWEAVEAEQITDEMAAMAWLLVATRLDVLLFFPGGPSE